MLVVCLVSYTGTTALVLHCTWDVPTIMSHPFYNRGFYCYWKLTNMPLVTIILRFLCGEGFGQLV